MKTQDSGLRLEDGDDWLALSRAADVAWGGEIRQGRQNWLGWIDQWRRLALGGAVGCGVALRLKFWVRVYRRL